MCFWSAEKEEVFLPCSRGFTRCVSMCDVIWNSFLGKKGKLVLEEHFAADLYALHVLGKGIYK